MKFVCLDLETTGFDETKDQIIEVAAVIYQNGKEIDRIDELVDPEIPIPPIVTAITGIKDEDVRGKRTFSDIKNRVAEFIGELPIVGHNINFDIKFLQSKGVPLRNNKEIDTLELSTILLEGEASYSLESLGQKFNIVHENKHRALDDVLANAKLFFELIKKIESLPNEKLENICHYLSKSNWGPKQIFFDILIDKDLDPKPFEIPQLKQSKKENTAHISDEITTKDIKQIFGDDGGLKKIYKEDHETRHCQQQMAGYIWDSLSDKKHLICEAGTGTGKSLAYLIPSAIHAIKNDEKVIISTHTNNLQDQLIEKDVPVAQKIIENEFDNTQLQVTVLKGRKHYLSLYRLEKFLDRDFYDIPEVIGIIKIILMLESNRNGERDTFNFRGKENLIWNDICCKEDYCPHNEHSANYPCYLLKNRDDAQKSHIIVTNHALLFRDCMTPSPILPEYKSVIIDEAHNIEDSATNAFSLNLNNYTFDINLSKIQKTLITDNRLEGCRQELSLVKNSLTIGFGLLGIFLENYSNPQSKYQNEIIIDEYKKDSIEWVKIVSTFKKIHNELTSIKRNGIEILEEITNESLEIIPSIRALKSIDELTSIIEDFFITETDNTIMWGNISREGVPYLKTAPISLEPYLKKYLFEKKDSVILTSATLSVMHNFEFIKSQIGILDDIEEKILPSPFFYEEQAEIIVAEDIPEPSANGHMHDVIETLRNIIDTQKGKILVLLTAKASINAIYQKLYEHCKEIDVNLYAQGISGGRGKIMQNYRREYEKSVILGLHSFWEGVDLPGEMLSTVIIQKLPFSPPSDPLHIARAQNLNDSFGQYSVPRAILKFKQGFGRLIRSNRDSGTLIILDSRITNKQYGRAFLESLPEGIPIRYTQAEDVHHYLKSAQ